MKSLERNQGVKNGYDHYYVLHIEFEPMGGVRLGCGTT